MDDNPPNLMGHRVSTGDGIIGASLRRVAIGGSNVHQPCFPPQVLSGYYGKGVCEKFEKHKVRKELVSK